MVEGPCCALYAERLRARVRKGQAVRSARGSASAAGVRAATTATTVVSEESISGHSFLNGHVYRGVETLGKELFMYFGQTALRVHFGMNGSMCINRDESKGRNGAPPVLEIQLTEDTVCFFEATVEYRNAAESKQKVRMMESLDVCSPKFSCSRAESEIKQQKTRMLCDVLLDQAVLPGVGNIIKNEALFDSGLHPAVKVCQLTDKHISHLVKMTRDFALLFYKVRLCVSENPPKLGSSMILALCNFLVEIVKRHKTTNASVSKNLNLSAINCELSNEKEMVVSNILQRSLVRLQQCRKMRSALYKHYKVYRQPSCGQCDGNITACRLGENNRMTYFCCRCQKADAQLVNISKLPTRNSLIGWVYGRRSCSNEHVAQKSEEEWTCVCCTLINKPSAKICDACLTSRSEVPKTGNDDDSGTFNRSLMKYPCNDFGKPSVEIKINRKAAFGHTTLVVTDLSSKVVQKNDIQILDGHPQSVSLKNNLDQIPNDVRQSRGSTDKYCSTNVTVAMASPSHQQAFSFKPIQKKQKTDHVPSILQQNTGISEPQVNMTDGICSLNTGHPRCSKHSRLCILRVVRKDGENKGRQFYTCPLPRKCRCDYFQWADLNFPFCNHGKRCVMKTVLKIGPNNGKNFFVCPSVKEKQCGFFQWAEQQAGMQIIP